MAIRYVIVLVGITLLFSCEFRIVKNPGQQASSQVKWSKDFDVYLSEFKPTKKSQNLHLKYHINQVFVERQYRHDGGLFSGFDIDKTSIQFVITDSLKREWSNDKPNFTIDGFNYQYSKNIQKLSNTEIPDTLYLTIELTDFQTNELTNSELQYVRID